MSQDNNELAKGRKKKTWIKFYPEKWIFGSSREELTNAERAVWMDLLALAALNDPTGYVTFLSFKRLASQLNISLRLLNSTIEKAIAFDKIEITEEPFGSSKEEVILKNDQKGIKGVPKNTHFDPNQSKIGLTLRTIKILKWNEYQSEYMRQRPHREKQKNKEFRAPQEADELQDSGPKDVTQVTERGEERNGEERTGDERRQNPPINNSPNSPLPSTSLQEIKRDETIKDQFLTLLRNLSGYPYDEMRDSLLFDLTIKEYPKINILRQVGRKIRWWKDHPDALEANPRKQLQEFFREEAKFQQRGGPQKIGDILGIEDENHRRFLSEIVSGGKKNNVE